MLVKGVSFSNPHQCISIDLTKRLHDDSHRIGILTLLWTNTVYSKKRLKSQSNYYLWTMGDFHVTTILLHVIPSLSGGNECTGFGHTQSDQTSSVWVNGNNFDLINLCGQRVWYCWHMNCDFGRYYIWNRTVFILEMKGNAMLCYNQTVQCVL